MIIRQVYNHEYASIVETDSSYLFFGGRNIGAFKVGEELTAPCEPYKVLMKWNISKAVENMIKGYLIEIQESQWRLPSINRIKCLVWYHLALVPMVSRGLGHAHHERLRTDRIQTRT